MTTVNICGFTGQDNGWPGSNRKGVLMFSHLLFPMLRDAGFDPYFATEGCDRNIVFTLDLSSRSAAHADYAFDVLERDPRAIVALPDWNVRGVFKTMRSLAVEERWPKNHHTYTADQLKAHQGVMADIVEGRRTTLFPGYKTGDASLLEIPGHVVRVDPSIYVPAPDHPLPPRQELIAVHASLAKKWSDLNKRRYTILNVREEPEQAVLDYYAKFGICLVPAHYSQGSGWWRDRYTLANQARAVVVEDIGGPFGETFEVERKKVTEKTFDKIFEVQDAWYRHIIESKADIIATLQRVFE